MRETSLLQITGRKSYMAYRIAEILTVLSALATGIFRTTV